MQTKKITSWQDVSIRQYYDILDIIESDILNEPQKWASIISIIDNISYQDAFNMPLVDFSKRVSELGWISKTVDVTKMPNTKITISNEKYILNTDISKMTAAQYIDFQTLWAKKDLKQYFGNILACFIIPKGKKYNDGYDINALADTLLDEIDIVTAQRIVFFSLTSLINSMSSSLPYLDQAIQMMNRCSPMMKLRMKKILRQHILTGLVSSITSQILPD